MSLVLLDNRRARAFVGALLGLAFFLWLLAHPPGRPAQAADSTATNAPTAPANPSPAPAAAPTLAPAAAAAPAAPPNIVNYTYDVVHSYPHDRRAFTQGLVYLDGKFLESTGLTNQSTLREVDLATGKVLRKVDVPGTFAEGLALLDGKLYQLTWKGGKGFVYDLKTFAKLSEFSYAGEGWGLTTDGKWLILSDGTSDIRFLDPVTFQVDHVIHVTKQGDPQANLNELEWVNGQIFANIWGSDWIARIDPATGRAVGMIDFSYLLPLGDKDSTTEVLNGIAYDPAGDRLFITGKNWPKVFEVRLKAK